MPIEIRELEIQSLQHTLQSGTSDELVQKLAGLVHQLHRDLRHLEAAVSIHRQLVVIKSGDASITLKPDGTIQIKGKDISSESSGATSIKASTNLVLKGQKILEN